MAKPRKSRYQGRAQTQKGVAGLGVKTQATSGALAKFNPPPVAPVPEATPAPDPALLAQQAHNANALRLGNIWDTYQQGQIGLDYGFNASGGIDAANPYSRASLLQRTYEQNRRGTTNSMAAQGQLYSGAHGRAQDTVARNYDIDLDQLRKGQASELGNILKGKLDRYSTYGSSSDSAQLESILRALGG